MARRNRSNQNDDSTPNEVQEDNVSTTTEEVTEASPEAIEATVQATDEEVEAAPAAEQPAAAAEVDLSAFEAAVTQAVSEKDTSTGVVAPAVLEPVQKAYRDLDGLKAKNKAKAFVNEGMKSAMNSMDIVTARAYLAITDALAASAGAGGSTPKAPADPTEAFVQRVVGLRLALELATDTVPEGVADGWQDKARGLFESELPNARTYSAWVSGDEESRGDEPEASNVVKAAVKLSQGKTARVGKSSGGGGSTFTGERRDIAKHIQSAFEEKETGEFLSIAEIKNHQSAEYGDSSPSAGAISARLFPKSGGACTVEGIRPETNEKGKKGAVKV